jgi:uncharacterized glyoxalase superfamily protein PhnB
MDSSPTATTSTTTVWPCLTCQDARGLINFLVEAFGFEETFVAGGDGDVIHHAELRWPLGGGIMLGSVPEPGDDWHDRMPRGPMMVYIVTDDPDGLFERATARGANVEQGLKDEDYGSRDFTVTDPEGNFWTFGTYPGG